MSAFLWVEDFEGGQYREFAHALFGRALKLEANSFPNEECDLRGFMKSHQVEIATSFAEAARRIDENLRDYDYVVLDIDLNLLGEDQEEDRLLVLPLLERWYKYDPKAINEEASYEAARQKMKMVAGYHLYIDLVMNRGFPRKRIQFCSNHGDNLVSINESFEPALIEAPSIPRKSDEEARQWIVHQSAQPYIKLRRWVILACQELLDRMKHNKIQFTMLDLPRKENAELTENNAVILLETLPKLLQAHENSETERKIAFRIFVRTLTQDWDKVDYKNREIKNPVKAFAAVLTNVRHWTSHDAKALSVMDEGDVAYLFLITMRSCFNLPKDKLEDYEKVLFTLIGEMESLDMNKLTTDYIKSNSDIEDKCALLEKKYETNFFSAKVNALQQGSKITPEEQPKFLYQILWHELHWPSEKGFSPQPSNFNKLAFLNQMTKRIYQRSFRQETAGI